jgi:hypothetical protein
MGNCCTDENLFKEMPVAQPMKVKAEKKKVLDEFKEDPEYKIDVINEPFFQLNPLQKAVLKDRGMLEFDKLESYLKGTEELPITRIETQEYKYIGQSLNGQLQGKGHIQMSNGDFYIATFFKNEPNGYAAIYYSNGDYFKGTIDGGQKVKGVLIFANSNVYEGCFSNGKFHGDHEVSRMKDGRKYIGGFVNGKREGYGEYTWANGSNYKGEWKNNLQHGKGVFTDKNGVITESVFENGQEILN